MDKIQELSHILNSYLEQREHLSLNSLAQNMSIPETSLRRIKHGDLKRMPKNETVLKLLSYIFKTEDLYTIRENLNPQGLGEYLTNEFFLSDSAQKLNIKLIDESVADQTTYLVFKLASNSCGTNKSEIQRLFGELGLKALESLERDSLVSIDGDKVHSLLDSFKVSNDYFIRNFKAVSEFINTDCNSDIPNLFYNLSESVNEKAAEKIHSIQSRALRDISSVLNNDDSRGEIPLFILSAVDTLS